MDKKYNIFTLSGILQSRETTLQWLCEVELIPSSRYCAKHKKQMTLSESDLGYGLFRCQKKGEYSLSVADKTWFERCHISVASFVLITYYFAVDMRFD